MIPRPSARTPLLPAPAAALAAGLVAGLLASAAPARAQAPVFTPEPGNRLEAGLLGGGPRLRAEVVQSLTADTNFGLDDPSDGTSYYADTRFIVGLLAETPVQAFRLDIDTGLRALWEAEEDFDFTFASPTTTNLGYAREWANGSGDGFLRFRRRDVDQTTIDIIDLDPTDGAPPDDIREIEADATERRYDGGFNLALATDSPSSWEFGFTGTQFEYSGAGADNRTPRVTLAGDAVWLLQLNPVIAGALAIGYSWYEADNASETEIRQGEIDAGVVYDPNPLLQLRFGLGYAGYKREQLVNNTRETIRDDRGYVIRGGLRYAFEDVTVTGNLRLTNAAPETRLSGDLAAFYPLERSTLRGRLFQRYGGSDSGNEIRVTGGAIGIEREINTVSAVAFDLTAARQESLDIDEPDTDRLDFAASYSRELVADVVASVGYRFRALNEDPDEATSNSLFVEIGRAFETRP